MGKDVKKHSKLVTDVVRNRVSVKDALFQLKILLFDLGDESIDDWLVGELEGFKVGDDIPSYRKIRALLFGKVRQATFGHIIEQTMQIPVRVEEASKLETCLRENISIIEKWVGEDPSDKKIPMDLRLANYITAIEVNEFCQISSAWLVVPPATFSGIVDSVKIRLIDILLSLERQYGNLDDYLISYDDEEEKKKIAEKINKIIYNDNSVRVGDNNNIDEAMIGDDNGYKSRKK